MKLKNVKKRSLEEAKIHQISEEDYHAIKESPQFKFNWNVERGNSVYKIVLTDDRQNILGLMSLVDVSKEQRIHIRLIEVSIKNVGKGKQYDYIAGCLLAYACQLAFERSYDGFVSLVPKTALIALYCSKYGFTQYGRELALSPSSSLALIKKYL